MFEKVESTIVQRTTWKSVPLILTNKCLISVRILLAKVYGRARHVVPARLMRGCAPRTSNESSLMRQNHIEEFGGEDLRRCQIAQKFAPPNVDILAPDTAEKFVPACDTFAPGH